MDKKLVWKTNEKGTLNGHDPETDKVVLAGKDCSEPKRRRKILRKGNFHRVKTSEGKMALVAVGTNPDDLPRVLYPESDVTKNNILDLIMKGETLSSIGTKEGFPPTSTINQWLRKNEGDNHFKKDMAVARRFRAEAFHDKIIETAENVTEDEIGSAKVKLDAYKWAAGVNDPDTFGNRTKVVGDPNSPIAIVVDTGIRRELDAKDDEGVIVTTGHPLQEKTE